jgi:hypothetical protein
VYPPIDPGLTATQATAAHTAEVELELIKPGSGAKAEEL